MKFALTLMLCFITLITQAIVKYDEGRIQIDGIQLLQDKDDESSYYYLPRYPRIATDEEGNLNLLCIKYVGQGGASTNGGIFHALIQFDLSPEELDDLTTKLREKVPDGKIAGPVPLMQAKKDGEEGIAGFTVVSSILSNTTGENPFTTSIITSGHAPMHPGSRAAIAAKLNQEGTTLLWDSFQGPTSDVSISVQGYYEAAVEGYNAIVTADVSTVYKHFSELQNKQKGFTRQQMRNISDELVQENLLKIEVFDRAEGLGIKAGGLDGILNIVTNKLMEMMFNAESGWAKIPDYEKNVAAGQIPNRRKRGIMGRVFGKTKDSEYVTDNQYVLKKRTDIRSHKFYLNLSKSTSIKVPFYSTGNIGGSFFNELKEDKRYFRIVNMDDPDFQKRTIYFQLDGQYSDAFNDVLNFASVTFRKEYKGEHEEVTQDLIFRQDEMNEGNALSVIYPRLGMDGEDWLNYEYRLSWSLKGDLNTIQIPESQQEWISANSQAIPLIAPFSKSRITIDADRVLFKEKNIRSASIQFFVVLNGKARKQRSVLLHVDDVENIAHTTLFYDKIEPMMYQITWYTTDGKSRSIQEELKDDYLFFVPPADLTN